MLVEVAHLGHASEHAVVEEALMGLEGVHEVVEGGVGGDEDHGGLAVVEFVLVHHAACYDDDQQHGEGGTGYEGEASVAFDKGGGLGEKSCEVHEGVFSKL